MNHSLRVTVITLLLAVSSLSAATHYVSLESTNPTSPYTNWVTAATNIQQAVDATAAGEEIVVTNGIYVTGGRAVYGTMTNRVAVDKPLTLRSVNGPQFTLIQGYQVPGTTNSDWVIRCVYLTNGAILSGFTLTNGASRNVGEWETELSGGGVWCVSASAVVSNCVLTSNLATKGGGAYRGTLYNCALTGNRAGAGGFAGGGSGGGAYDCTLYNCTVTGNSAIPNMFGEGGYGGGAAYCTLNNCTLTGDSAVGFGGGAYGSALYNCIVYFNTAWNGANYDTDSTLNYCCTTPQAINGAGSITNAPLFVDYAGGNLRLQASSPCINAGNDVCVTTATDLDGRPRIVGGTVDMGAYEYRALLVGQASPTPAPPYTTWATAATNIQDAVDVSVAGDEIVVTNGVYLGGLAVTNPVTLLSVNGPQFTIINGGRTNRCAALTSGASLTGFTLSSGRAGNGGGVWSASTNAFLTNCLIVGNSANTSAGGAACCTLYNCTLSGNSAGAYGSGGGAAWCTLYNCTLTGNSALWAGDWSGWVGSGGGACASTLYDCVLADNSATEGGGASFSSLYNCTLTGNSAVINPSPPFYGGGGGGGAYGGTLYNCTVVDNVATDSGGGVVGSTLVNCIVAYNAAWSDDNYTSDSTLNYCCTWPLPTNGFGNIAVPPQFVDYAQGSLRLQYSSPCINAGKNACATSATDLDGNPRIVSGTVDIGAYEYQGTGSVISYAWLQHYGLPTDGSADFAHADVDGMNNWQEWVCGTCPTNPLSALCLLSAAPAGTDVTVTWQSVAGVNYFLERSANLTTAFTLLATNILGQPDTTTYGDNHATGAGPFFYHVGVKAP
jgi:hypothetical protein